jgi:hypothetical protein
MHAGQSYTILLQLAHDMILPDFLNCGFVVNFKKSLKFSVQRAEYLGMFVDTVRGCFEVHPAKRNRVIALIQSVLEHSACTVHSGDYHWEPRVHALGFRPVIALNDNVNLCCHEARLPQF